MRKNLSDAELDSQKLQKEFWHLNERGRSGVSIVILIRQAI